MVFFYKTNIPEETPKYVKVMFGGTAGFVSTVVFHPLDMVKVRMQLYPRFISTADMARKIIRCEGFSALYNGLSAGILRQATFTTTRLGVYYGLCEHYKKTYGEYPDLPGEVLIGTYAGMAGAFLGNPSELALVRLMEDAKPDPCCRCCDPRGRRYKGLVDVLYQTITQEGVCALWRGGMMTLTRAIIMNTVQIICSVHTSEEIERRNLASGLMAHVLAAVVTNAITSIITMPVDVIKTNVQAMGSHYLPQSDVIDDMMRKEGITYFWRGLLPYFTRLTTYSILAYCIVQYFDSLYQQVHFKNRNK